jgi:hypothetical protein
MKKHFLVLVVLFFSTMLFGQSKPIFGYPQINIGMTLDEFLKLSIDVVEDIDSGMSDVRVFLIGKSNNIDESIFRFYQNRLYEVALLMDTEDIPLSDFLSNIKSEYGDFDDEKAEVFDEGGYARFFTLQRNYNSNFFVTIYVLETFFGEDLLTQTYHCYYYDPTVEDNIDQFE